jgi:hypothetical protein
MSKPEQTFDIEKTVSQLSEVLERNGADPGEAVSSLLDLASIIVVAGTRPGDDMGWVYDAMSTKIERASVVARHLDDIHGTEVH